MESVLLVMMAIFWKMGDAKLGYRANSKVRDALNMKEIDVWNAHIAISLTRIAFVSL